jgi:hypothetical protein
VKLSFLLVPILLLLQNVVCAQEFSVSVEPQRIVKQTEDLRFTCALASILNCFAFGSEPFRAIYERIPGTLTHEKLSFVVSKYGSMDSVVKPGKKAYVADEGMYDEDVLRVFDALLSDYKGPQVNGLSAERLNGETSFDYLRRIHQNLSDSLAKGIPVVASVDSYVAHEYKDIPALKWKGGYSHTMLITGVSRNLAEYAKGFRFTFVDSLKGTIEEGYIYAEDAREFQAVRRKGKDFEWLSGSPFLLTVLPSLSLATEREPSNSRTIMTLGYIIGRFAE